MISYEYIAGFFDGEGGFLISGTLAKYIKINSRGALCKTNTTRWRYAAYICNTNLNVLEIIKGKIGGNIEKTTHLGLNKKSCYRLVIVSSGVKEFIDCVYPYLFIKKERADIMLAFISTIQKGSRKGMRPPILSYETKLIRHNLFLKLAKLNARGTNEFKVPKLPPPEPPESKFTKCKSCNSIIKKHKLAKSRKKVTGVCYKCYHRTIGIANLQNKNRLRKLMTDGTTDSTPATKT